MIFCKVALKSATGKKIWLDLNTSWWCGVTTGAANECFTDEATGVNGFKERCQTQHCSRCRGRWPEIPEIHIQSRAASFTKTVS